MTSGVSRVTPKLALIVLSSIVLATLVSWHALVMSSRALRPEFALRLDATDPVAIARVMSNKAALSIAQGKALPSDTSKQASSSLRGLALNPVALRMLAISKPPATVTSANASLLHLSDRVSRRDLGTQILLVGTSGRRGDIAGVLDAYDKALRTTRSSRPLLFPLLAKLMVIPEARTRFGRFFDQKSDWLPAFLTVSLNDTEAPDSYFDLLIRQKKLLQLPRPDEVRNVLVNQLVAKSSFTNARSAFMFGESGNQEALSSASITPETLRQDNTLYWFFPEASGRYAVPVANRFLTVSIDPGHSGTVAQKVLYLEPGRYLLRTVTDRSESDTGLRLQWIMQCLQDGSPAIGSILEGAQIVGTTSSEAFAAPDACAAIRLILTAERRSGNTLSDDRVIEQVSITRAR